MRYFSIWILFLFSGFCAFCQENSIFAGGIDNSSAYSCFAMPSSNSIFAGGNESFSEITCYEELVQVISGKVFLGGPFDEQTGSMRDDLRAQGLLPLTEPYSNLGIYAGSTKLIDSAVLAATGQSAIIDWILVEFRNANNASLVTNQLIGLLQSNGTVVELDGISPLKIRANEDSAFIAIRHRNHLGALLSTPFSLNGVDTVFFDFSDPDETKAGNGATQRVGSVDVLWAGNTVLAGQGISYIGSNNDRDAILVSLGGNNPTNLISEYEVTDVNMDGQVKYTGVFNDRDIILVNIGGGVPTVIRTEQLP